MRLSTLLGLALVALGVLNYVGAGASRSTAGLDRPTDTLAIAVQPVASILKGHREDGQRLAAFYLAEADVISRDQGKVIQNTAVLREVNRRAGLLAFQRTGIEGKYLGLGEAIDKVLADRLGLENVPLDEKKQAAAIEIFKALAWACSGG